MTNPEEIRRVAKRFVWFKTPEEALQDKKLFLAHVMTYGTLEDIVTTMKYYSDGDFDLVFGRSRCRYSLIGVPEITGTCATATNPFRHCPAESFPVAV